MSQYAKVNTLSKINNFNELSIHQFQIVIFSFWFLGDFLIFSVYNKAENNCFFKLNDFLREIDNPLQEAGKIYLAGVVGYSGISGIPRRHCDDTVDDAPDGHYVAYSYRRGNSSWMEANDHAPKTKNRSGKHKIVPRLIVYVKSCSRIE